MSAPFLGDNEDEVDLSIFSPQTAVTEEEDFVTQESDDVLALRTDQAVLDEIEDHRTPNEKKIDGDDVTSDEDDVQEDKQKSGSAKKKLRSLEVKKKVKQPELTEILMMHAKEKNQRSEKRNELSEQRYGRKYDLMEKSQELDYKRHTDNFRIQMEEMDLRKRQLKLEEEKTEIRKMELQALLQNQAKSNGITFNNPFVKRL